MSSTKNVIQYVVSVAVVAVLSEAAKRMGYLQGSTAVPMVIKGFLTFFTVALIYFPVSLMLGGIPYRNKFFQRAADSPHAS